MPVLRSLMTTTAKLSGIDFRNALPGRPVSASRTEMIEMVLPQDANLLGNILGGRVMHLIDIAGAIAAGRHCHRQAVTRKRIIRLCGDEFFEHLAACFLLRLGHGLEARIIVGLGPNTKSVLGRTDTHVCPERLRHNACGQARVPVLLKRWQKAE